MLRSLLFIFAVVLAAYNGFALGETYHPIVALPMALAVGILIGLGQVRLAEVLVGDDG